MICMLLGPTIIVVVLTANVFRCNILNSCLPSLSCWLGCLCIQHKHVSTSQSHLLLAADAVSRQNLLQLHTQVGAKLWQDMLRLQCQLTCRVKV